MSITPPLETLGIKKKKICAIVLQNVWKNLSQCLCLCLTYILQGQKAFSKNAFMLLYDLIPFLGYIFPSAAKS